MNYQLVPIPTDFNVKRSMAPLTEIERNVIASVVTKRAVRILKTEMTDSKQTHLRKRLSRLRPDVKVHIKNRKGSSFVTLFATSHSR